jgi:rfaE bifunctional protein nucleotidyltransferase chain/domain
MLQAARRLGDCLVVCLNSDSSVRRLKGSDRPLVGEDDRAAVLRSLACVDAVLLFDEDTPAEALRLLRPDVFVKGADYDASRLPEADVMTELGGRVVTVPYVAGRSTSSLIGKALLGAR